MWFARIPFRLKLFAVGAFVLLAFAASIGATVARIVAQPEMHR